MRKTILALAIAAGALARPTSASQASYGYGYGGGYGYGYGGYHKPQLPLYALLALPLYQEARLERLLLSLHFPHEAPLLLIENRHR